MSKSILYVEDNDDNIYMLKPRLERLGFDVKIATDGKSALNLIKTSKPNLILMDLELPIMDGFEATKILKQNPDTSEIPVIALSACVQDEDKKNAFEAGCDDFEQKPVEFDVLVKKINALIIEHAELTTEIKKGQRHDNKILIIDDNENDQYILSEYLNREGFNNIEIASNGEHALDILNTNNFDLVLMDMNMPVMDGIETLSKMKNDLSLQHIPVIMISGISESNSISQCIEIGAEAYVIKPFDKNILRSKINSALNQKELTKYLNLIHLPEGYSIQWYQIKKVIGHGGFAFVYQAHDPKLNRDVVIKEYLPSGWVKRKKDGSVHPSSSEYEEDYKWGLDSFVKETRILEQFNHPNIVRVLSVSEENNTAYLVMNYEQGQSLQKILKGKKTLEEKEIMDILIPILNGMKQIHDAGFIHRDIKPDNILINQDGSPILLDFGSARQTLGEQNKTLTRLVTPGYAPFEQYSSNSDEQGPWTDIYALGATLYRAISGLAPIDAIERSNALLMHSKEILWPALNIGSGRYSEKLLNAIDHALEFKPSDRPQSIQEWLEELNQDLE
jgi:CheY-like chemotaxis protein